MNKTDLIIGLVVIVIAIGLGASQLIPKEEAKQAYISVQIDGKEVEQIPMDAEHEGKVYRYQAHGGTNQFKITEAGCEMIHSDCPDGICLRMAPIKRPGEMIVCLPHRIILEVKSDQTPKMDMMLK